MKKLGLILLVGLIAFACKKDEKSDPVPDTLQSKIVGKWFITDLEVDIKTAFGTLASEVESVKGYYNFNSDMSYDYDVDAQMLVTIPTMGEFPFPYIRKSKGTYKILDERTVEMEEQGQKTVFDIISATSTVVVATTETELDTLGIEMELEVDVVMEK